MKLSNIEKSIANQSGVSWTVVRDAAHEILRKRKDNADCHVTALGSDKIKGVSIAIKKNNATIAQVWVGHSETKLVKPVKELLEQVGYSFT